MSYEEQERKELLQFKKGPNTVITALVKGKTSDSIDIREYYTNDDGELAPTKKGIRFNAENLPDVIRALASVVEDKEEIKEILGEI